MSIRLLGVDATLPHRYMPDFGLIPGIADPDAVFAKASVSEAMWLHLLKHELDLDPAPVRRTAEVVCGKWTLLLIRDLADGHSRFCELERSLEGISPRTLSLRLRALEEEGIVERHTYPEVPPRVEYALTEKGEALVPLIDDMRTYGIRWLPAPDAEPVTTASRSNVQCPRRCKASCTRRSAGGQAEAWPCVIFSSTKR